MIPLTGSDPFPWVSMGGPAVLPDPNTTQKKKDSDETYDNQKARWHASKVSNVFIDWFRLQFAVNANFARGAWGIGEDRLNFLKDGQRVTSRQELTMPIVPPMVLRLSGQAASLSISAKAVAATQHAVTRKEMEMNRAVVMALAAQQGEFVASAVEANTGFGVDELRNRMNAESSFQDKITAAANSIMTMQERNNDYEGMRSGYAPLVSCSGMFATHCRVNGMELNWEFCHPYDIAWDTNTTRPDLQGEFMIHAPLMSVPEIARRWPLKKEEIERLDRDSFTMGGGRSVWPQGQPRVATVYYKDPQWTTLGWILKNDRPTLIDFDALDPETDKPLYKEKELIEPPKEGKYAKYGKAWKGKTHKSYIEVMRYCTFLPYEYSPGSVRSGEKWDGKKNGDLVLEHGVCPLQEPDYSRPRKTGFPIKMSTTQFINGFVIAPITAAISPQRIANLVSADLVWRMSKAGNISQVYDSRALAGSNMTLEDIQYAQKEGNPIEMDGSIAGGLNNAIARSDASLPQSFYQMWNIPEMVNRIAQQGTGLTDATQGQMQNGQQLVGTTQLLLQQSNTMMQPFVKCFIEGFTQMHQFDAQAGKEFYRQFGWALADMVGDVGLEAIMASDGMALEQFRVTIEPSVNSTQMKAATDQMILQFLQLGLLDAATAAELGGKSYPEDVWNGARTFTKQVQQAQVQQAEDSAKQQQAGMLSQAAADLQRRQDETYAQGYELMSKQAGFQQKALDPFLKREAEATIPVPSEQPQPAMV